MRYLSVQIKITRYLSFQREKLLFRAVKESCGANRLRYCYSVAEVHVHYELKPP